MYKKERRTHIRSEKKTAVDGLRVASFSSFIKYLLSSTTYYSAYRAHVNRKINYFAIMCIFLLTESCGGV